MRGMVFAGCSFTHGHGLWNYGDFDVFPTDSQILHEKVDAYENFTKIKRFPRLVANHFNTWEFVRHNYSGDDEESVGLLNHIFQLNSNINYTLENVKFDFTDISHVIFQTSYIDRCSFIFDEETSARERITEIPSENWIQILSDWKCVDFNDYIFKLKKQWYSEIRKCFTILENNGVRCYWLSITDDYLDLKSKDDFMNSRFIQMEYDSKRFNTIMELFEYDNSLKIKYDFKNLKTPPDDEHPSLKCHEIISNSIINHIEKNGI